MSAHKVDEQLLSILKSEPDLKQIKYLLSEDVLNNDEIQLCNQMIEQLGILGNYKVENIFKHYGITSDECKQINSVPRDNLINKIEDLIIKKREEQNMACIKEALNESTYSIFNKKAIDLIDSRYKTNISLKERDILSELEGYCSLDADEYIETKVPIGIEYIDKITEGIPVGKVTSIVGINNIHRNLLSINIAYNLITSGKNVIYISFDNPVRYIYLELISRHSCLDRFKSKLSINELTTKFDRNAYISVYENIKDDLSFHLQVFDYDDVNIQNISTLRRLFVKGNENFLKNSGEFADVVIIEGLDNLIIQTPKRIITNKNQIQNEYYTFLKGMAADFLGLNIEIPIIVTNGVDDKYIELVETLKYINLQSLNPAVATLSSMILSIYGNDKKSDIAELSLLKSPNKNVINQLVIRVIPENILVYYNDECLTEQDYKDKLLKYKIKENKDLIEENRRLEESNQYLNDLFIRSSAPVIDDVSLDELGIEI